MIKNYWNRGKRQKTITIIVSIILLIALFFLRDDYQPFLLFIRKYIFIILVSALVLFLLMRKFRSTPSTGKRIALLGAVAAYFGLLYLVGWHYKMYDYMKTYNVFNNLKLMNCL